MPQPPAVLVTGASTGIGEACALCLTAPGFRVFAGVRRTEDGERLGARGGIESVLLDVTVPAQIAAAASDLAGKVGDAGLAGLVHNAGIAVGGPREYLSSPRPSPPARSERRRPPRGDPGLPPAHPPGAGAHRAHRVDLRAHRLALHRSLRRIEARRGGAGRCPPRRAGPGRHSRLGRRAGPGPPPDLGEGALAVRSHRGEGARRWTGALRRPTQGVPLDSRARAQARPGAERRRGGGAARAPRAETAHPLPDRPGRTSPALALPSSTRPHHGRAHPPPDGPPGTARVLSGHGAPNRSTTAVPFPSPITVTTTSRS